MRVESNQVGLFVLHEGVGEVEGSQPGLGPPGERREVGEGSALMSTFNKY